MRFQGQYARVDLFFTALSQAHGRAAGGPSRASGDKIAVAGPVQVFHGEAWSQLVEAAIIQDLLQEVPGMTGSQPAFGKNCTIIPSCSHRSNKGFCRGDPVGRPFAGKHLCTPL
jgi:hypothetical protein